MSFSPIHCVNSYTYLSRPLIKNLMFKYTDMNMAESHVFCLLIGLRSHTCNQGNINIEV